MPWFILEIPQSFENQIVICVVWCGYIEKTWTELEVVNSFTFYASDVAW